MRPVEFSWRYASYGWLGALALGAMIAVTCAILSVLMMNAHADVVTTTFAGLGYALLGLIRSYPLRSLVGHSGWNDQHLWWLIVPNFALLGLVSGLAFGFVGKPRGTPPPVDARPYFRMDDGRD